MAFVESLLTAIVRADGDALVMHVGEKPYVVASAGPIELSAQALNLQAMAGMTTQLLPPEAQRALTEFGAVEHELAARPEMHGDRFSVVVARGGDDVWIEMRRHRRPLDTPHSAPDSAEASAPQPEPSRQSTAELAGAATSEPSSDEATSIPVHVSAPASETESAHAASGVHEMVAAAAVESDVAQKAESLPEAEDALGSAPEIEVAPAWQNDPEPMPVAASESEPEPAPLTVAGAEPEPVLSKSDEVAAESRSAAEVDNESDTAAEIEPGIEPEIEDAVEPEPAPGIAAVAAATQTTAAVIPMTRTLRIEVPPAAPRVPVAASEIERLLAAAAARGATALYLTTQATPYIRVDADVRMLDGEPPLTAADVESAVVELMPESAQEAMRRGEPSEWEAELADIGPVRCSTFRDHRGPGAIFQLVSMRPVSAEQLGLAREIQALSTEHEGLVLVASPRANGKTTVIGSLVDLINRRRPSYVITLERQIRVIHDHHCALISQREVRGTKDDLVSVARAALRENPDVLVIEDLSTAEMCQIALDAAGAGVLVLASVTAVSTSAALARLVELFPVDKRRGLHALLADRFRGAVAQTLLRKASGGRVAAREVLVATAPVVKLIADGQLAELPAAMSSGRKHGLVSLTEALVELIRTGDIDLREAYRKADDRDALVAALRRDNLESDLLERLA